MLFLRGPSGPSYTHSLMNTYFEQKEAIASIDVKDGESRRLDCPFCFGKYTFTITKKEGKTFWNCYKASCTAKGQQHTGYSLDAAKARIAGHTADLVKRSLPLPKLVSNPKHHSYVMDYLRKVNCSEALTNHWIDIKLDPARNRVLFYMNEGKGAVGRSVDDVRPKWLSYGDTTGALFVKPGSNHCIVVEDAASACSVARVNGLTGVALLGTNITQLQKKQILVHSQVTIVLDKDASRKAIKLASQLKSSAINSTIAVSFTDEDLKYLTTERINELVNRSSRT